MASYADAGAIAAFANGAEAPAHAEFHAEEDDAQEDSDVVTAEQRSREVFAVETAIDQQVLRNGYQYPAATAATAKYGVRGRAAATAVPENYTVYIQAAVAREHARMDAGARAAVVGLYLREMQQYLTSTAPEPFAAVLPSVPYRAGDSPWENVETWCAKRRIAWSRRQRNAANFRHWFVYPDEDLKSGMFAVHERRCMWQCVAAFYESGLLGRKFALMSMAFPGRTGQQCGDHFRMFSKRLGFDLLVKYPPPQAHGVSRLSFRPDSFWDSPEMVEFGQTIDARLMSAPDLVARDRRVVSYNELASGGGLETPDSRPATASPAAAAAQRQLDGLGRDGQSRPPPSDDRPQRPKPSRQGRRTPTPQIVRLMPDASAPVEAHVDHGWLARPLPRRMEPAGGARGAPYPLPGARHVPSGGAAAAPPGSFGGLAAGWCAVPMQGVDGGSPGIMMMPSPALTTRVPQNGDPAAGPLAMPSLDVLQNFHESRPIPLENSASTVLYQMLIDADGGRYHHDHHGGQNGYGYGGAVHHADTAGAGTGAPMMRSEPVDASHMYPMPGGYIVELPPAFFATQPWWPGGSTPMFAFPQHPTVPAPASNGGCGGGSSSSASSTARTSAGMPRVPSAAMDDL